MPKIESLRSNFENMSALLGRMAEDDSAVGFIGCVLHKDGTMQPVHFCASREHMAFAAAYWMRQCLEDID